jgi:hypothetical protein
MAATGPPFQIDIHGLLSKEVAEVVLKKIKSGQETISKGAQHPQWGQLALDDQNRYTLRIITGRGAHSRDGVPILYQHTQTVLK